MASGKPFGDISVSTLGVGGVNLVADPLAMADNEVTLAQNAEPYRERGIAGIRKRPGLVRVVPTGTVSPSAAVGVVVGSQIVDFGTTDPNPGTLSIYLPLTSTSGQLSTDGGATWTSVSASSAPALTLAPNAKYTVGSYEFTPCYAPWIGGSVVSSLVYGAHAAGQIIVVRNPSPGVLRQSAVQIFSGGSNDDTLVLGGVWSRRVGDTKQYACVITTSGHAALYTPDNDEIIPLPDFTGSALATGSANIAGRLWVANGTNISSIDPTSPAAWTDTAVSFTGVSQLLGLASMTNGLMYAGSKQTSAAQFAQMFKITPNTDGTATVASSMQTQWGVGTAPTYIFGPFPLSTSTAPLYALSGLGGNGTLGGTDAGAADALHAFDILEFTVAGKWRQIVDIQNNASLFNGASNRAIGPIVPKGYTGKFWYGVDNTHGKFAMARESSLSGDVWSASNQTLFSFIGPLIAFN